MNIFTHGTESDREKAPKCKRCDSRNPDDIAADEKMADDLVKGAREKAEAPGPNAKASVRDLMTSGTPDMGRKGWRKPLMFVKRWVFRT